MITRLRELAERPISEGERPRAFALAAAIVVIAATGLLLARSPEQEATTPQTSTDAAPITSPAPAQPGAAGEDPLPSGPGSAPRPPEAAARRFLDGYLAYLYGRGSTSEIRAAAPQLIRRLRRRPPRISPATRKRRPRVVEISAAAQRHGREIVTAEIADGDVARYPIELALRRRGGRWRVARVETD